MKQNQLPQLIVSLLETIEDRSVPQFQKDLAAATLERINNACNMGLMKYNQTNLQRKRG